MLSAWRPTWLVAVSGAYDVYVRDLAAGRPYPCPLIRRLQRWQLTLEGPILPAVTGRGGLPPPRPSTLVRHSFGPVLSRPRPGQRLDQMASRSTPPSAGADPPRPSRDQIVGPSSSRRPRFDGAREPGDGPSRRPPTVDDLGHLRRRLGEGPTVPVLRCGPPAAWWRQWHSRNPIHGRDVRVVFEGDASDLGATAGNATTDIYLRDLRSTTIDWCLPTRRGGGQRRAHVAGRRVSRPSVLGAIVGPGRDGHQLGRRTSSSGRLTTILEPLNAEGTDSGKRYRSLVCFLLQGV